jgi:hypothetical protein
MGFSIVTANDEPLYIAVYMSSINNNKLSIYLLSKSESLSINGSSGIGHRPGHFL